MKSSATPTRDIPPTGGQFDGEVWHLRDGALGVAWSVRSEAVSLVHLVTNFLYDPDFAGAYLQLLWGAEDEAATWAHRPARVLMLLKSFLPRPETSWACAARRLVAFDAGAIGSTIDRRGATRAAITGQAEDLEHVATFAGLRPVRLADPDGLERARRVALGVPPSPSDRPRTGAEIARRDRRRSDPERLGPEPPPVASLRRYRVEAIEDLSHILTDRPGFRALRCLTFVQARRTDHAAHGWLYPILSAPADSFAHLERVWSSAGYRLVPERTLAVPARLFLAPFGPSPALEASLAPCAVRVVLGERPRSPAADEPSRPSAFDGVAPPPAHDLPVELPWAA